MSPTTQPATPPKGRILVLEDDARLQQLLLTVLRFEQYDAVGASTGEQALRAVRDQQPDLVLLDLIVPELSGWEFMRRLREDARWSHIPVLLVSSVQDLALEARLMGADGYLAKPFLVEDLLSEVSALVHRSRPAFDQAGAPAEL
jgi:DNA-binding response OmpR family regulator